MIEQTEINWIHHKKNRINKINEIKTEPSAKFLPKEQAGLVLRMNGLYLYIKQVDFLLVIIKSNIIIIILKILRLSIVLFNK